MKKRKILKQAARKADEPLWFVYYVFGNDEYSEVKVYAKTEKEAREKAFEIIKAKVDGDFKITGMAAI